MWDKWDVVVEGAVATWQRQRTSGSVALLTILMRGQPHSPASVPPYECGRRFHTGKSGSAASFQRQWWLSISARRHNGGKDPDRCHSVARRTPLIGRRGRQQFGSNQMGLGQDAPALPPVTGSAMKSNRTPRPRQTDVRVPAVRPRGDRDRQIQIKRINATNTSLQVKAHPQDAAKTNARVPRRSNRRVQAFL